MKSYVRFVAPMLALVSLSACGASPQERYDRAQVSYSQSDFESARLDLVAALEETPGDAQMLTLLARTQIGMGDGEGALLSLGKLASSNSLPADFVAMRAESEILRGQFDQALTALGEERSASASRVRALAHIGLENVEAARKAITDGLSIDPQNAALLATGARFELATGNIVKARAYAEMALHSAPEMHDALLVSAQIYAGRNRLSDALAGYDAGLALHPSSLEMRMGKVAALGELDRLDEASELLAETVKMAPENGKLLYLQARLAAEREDWEDARTILQGNENILRDNPNMQVIYAQSLLELGQVEQARTWLMPIVRSHPRQRLARQLLADAQLQAGDAKGALDTLRPVAVRPDASPEELTIAAQAARKMNDPAAIDFAKRAKLPAPEWLGGEMAKADTALRNGNWAQASSSYERIAERLARPNAMVLNNLAFAKGKLGEGDEAVELALRAVEVAPENASVLDTAGVLLIETGADRERGKALIRKAARLDPDNSAIARHVSQLVK